jgi:hypothetical protein
MQIETLIMMQIKSNSDNFTQRIKKIILRLEYALNFTSNHHNSTNGVEVKGQSYGNSCR